MVKHHPPSRLHDFLARCLEGYAVALAQHGGGAGLAFGVEHGDESAHDEVIYLLLRVRQRLGIHACGDDGMVVGHLLVVEHLLRLQ